MEDAGEEVARRAARRMRCLDFCVSIFQFGIGELELNVHDCVGVRIGRGKYFEICGLTSVMFSKLFSFPTEDNVQG